MDRRCSGSETLPIVDSTRSIYGKCAVCEYMVVIRRDGMLRKHFVTRTKGAENTHQRRIKERLDAMDQGIKIIQEVLPHEEPGWGTDEPGWEGREDIYNRRADDPTPTESKITRKIEITSKRLRINIVIETVRST